MITDRGLFVFKFIETVLTVIGTRAFVVFELNLNVMDIKSLRGNLSTVTDHLFFKVPPRTSNLFFFPTQRPVPNFGCVLDDFMIRCWFFRFFFVFD